MNTAHSLKTDQAGQKVQYCTFMIKGSHYGVSILDVKEIYPDVDVTPIYHAPKEVKGYVNIRGQIYLILDMRIVFGYEEKVVDNDSCLLLFKPSVAEPFGILVDKIGDVIHAMSTQLEKTRISDPETASGADVIEGVCKLERSLLVILNPAKILDSIRSGMESS
jgi:chemotaxis signal transduction protein